MDRGRLFLVDGLFFHRAGSRKHWSLLLAGSRPVERLDVGTRVALEIFFASLRFDNLMLYLLNRLMFDGFVLNGLPLNLARRVALPRCRRRRRCFRNAELLIPTGRSRC